MILRYDDNGAFLGTPLIINRASGDISVESNLVMNGTNISGVNQVTTNTVQLDYVKRLTIAHTSVRFDSAVECDTIGPPFRFMMTENNVYRFALALNNADSDFNIYRFADDGTFLDQPFWIYRETGNIGMIHDVSIGGALNMNNQNIDSVSQLTTSIITAPGALNLKASNISLSNPSGGSVNDGISIQNLSGTSDSSIQIYSQSGGINVSTPNTLRLSAGLVELPFSNLQMWNHNIIGLKDPVNPQDAVTKQYVDNRFNIQPNYAVILGLKMAWGYTEIPASGNATITIPGGGYTTSSYIVTFGLPYPGVSGPFYKTPTTFIAANSTSTVGYAEWMSIGPA